MWVSVLAVSCGCLALLLAHGDEWDAQVSYTPDTRYLRWTTTYPAVTVCEKFYSSQTQKKFVKYAPELMEPLNLNYRKYLTDLLYGLGTCTPEVCVPCGSKVPCEVSWRQIILHVHKACDELISECKLDGAAFPCCERFRSADSEHGPCFSFNTLQNKDSPREPLFTVNTSTGPGRLSFRLHADAYVSIHSPEELSTNNLDNKLKYEVQVRKVNWVELLFSIVEMENDPLLKFEEVNVYSYGACKLAQSTEDSYDECGCIHPVRALAYQDMYCNYTGLNCIVRFEANKIKLGIQNQKNRSQCLPSCTESELTMIHASERWVLDAVGQGTSVNVRMSSIPTLRYERNLLITNLDIVVSVGGTVGLLFGASILSLAEVFYLIFRNCN